MDMDYVSLGKSIKKHRTLSGMTQVQLAELVGCSDRHIGQIEKANNIPSLAAVVAIANALNMGLDQLVYGDLVNRADYFMRELVSITDTFDRRDKLMVIEMTKAITEVLRDFKTK